MTISMQANGLWDQLTTLKKVVTEPKGTGEAFDTVMKDYYTAIRRGQGGLFMAVCRGKVCTAAWTESGPAGHAGCVLMHCAVTSPLVTTGLEENIHQSYH